MTHVRQYGEALAVVTVTRSAEPVGRAITSLTSAVRRPFVVVHADSGGAAACPGATLLRLGEDIGRPAALNRAIAGLDGAVGWIAIADPDLEWGAGALDALLDTAAGIPRAGVLGPLVRDPSGRVVASSGAVPSCLDVARGRVRAGAAGWLDSSCMLLRRAAWDSVDGFDPRYVGSGRRPEPFDLDLGERLGRAGWLTVVVPSAEVTFGGPTGQGILEPYDRAMRRYARSRYRAPARAMVALARRVR